MSGFGWSKPQLLLSWRGPYEEYPIRNFFTTLWPLMCRLRRTPETQEISVRPAHLQSNHPRETPPSPQPQLGKLAVFFVGKRMPPPALGNPDETQHARESDIVDTVVSYRLWSSKPKSVCPSGDTTPNQILRIAQTRYQSVTRCNRL